MCDSVHCAMLLRKKAVAEIKAEIERLESARIDCTDARILKVIEVRIEERRLQLRRLESSSPERQQKLGNCQP
jgi:hypothetical protein